ncbi:hypothetical protein HMPREF1991_03003 [Hoylesella loescheii DSM 19665 = JCM 12249 = ATCC 15930]|uniref:Uncharacterized protein n=1 Tax=Hoylesella loescheii DSM 19665 = JCM 12249 = ATCC 15930 TaxID=1122985 RepID=A0A069QG12_HOYLO|nr:hypothetical protein HMPREF1991_03003 [Hoylesella loescheii DSM 19665 = JCM 12249 = ATCC 15930]
MSLSVLPHVGLKVVCLEPNTPQASLQTHGAMNLQSHWLTHQLTPQLRNS